MKSYPDDDRRDAVAYIRAVINRDGEAVRILTTYTDLDQLALQLARLATEALRAPADTDPTSWLDSIVVALDRGQQ
jgi:hypothetical protein